MKKKLATMLANYRTFAMAAEAITDAVSNAVVNEFCKAYFDKTPAVVALEKLEHETEVAYGYAQGSYNALSKAYSELSAMMPLTHEEQVMKSADWQWFHATWKLKDKELCEKYARATA